MVAPGEEEKTRRGNHKEGPIKCPQVDVGGVWKEGPLLGTLSAKGVGGGGGLKPLELGIANIPTILGVPTDGLPPKQVRIRVWFCDKALF